MPDATAAYRIDAAQRSLRLLEALAEQPDASAAELAQLVGAPRGSAFRHLTALEAGGYVRKAPATKRYSLGPRLIYLGFAARRQLRLPEVAAPLMEALRDRFGETVHLGVLSRGEVVHVGSAASTHPVKMDAAIGERTFAHVSALGKVLLAHADGDALETVLRERGLPALTGRSITSRQKLQAELRTVVENGYAVDDEESAAGLRCVAAPVRDARGEVTCALSVSAPAARLPARQIAPVAAAAVETADAIARRLGWSP